jgi:hypothetical protein
MLTDEELTRRLSTAFHEHVPELTYAGPVPQVRRGGTGLATTSALAAAAALAVTPAALQRDGSGSHHAAPSARPHAHHSPGPGRTVTRTLELGGLTLSFASADGDPGPLFFVIDPDATLPGHAQQLDVDLPGDVDVWYVPDAASGEPQVYVESHGGCPDTEAGCADTVVTPIHLFGILAPGWTRDQLIDLFEHPVETQRSLR